MTEAGNANQGPQLGIVRVYLKDVSFESPSSPEAFKGDFNPEIKLDVSSSSKKVDEKIYEVNLELTAEAKSGDKTVFIVELQQAGLFHVEGMEGEQLNQALGIFCPATLFPYARTNVDHLLNQGSFPSLMLAPINFEQIYKQRTAQNNSH